MAGDPVRLGIAGHGHPLPQPAEPRRARRPRPASSSPLRIGPLQVWPPVVLAPMAGVTNPPFRTLCRRFGAGLYVSEMITARALVEGNRKTLLLASFGPEETTRSLQLYGVDPHYVGEAVRLLVGEGRVDHLDMNFGCPVRKVTRKGGGAAIPLKPQLLRGDRARGGRGRRRGARSRSSSASASTTRHETFLDAGRIAQEEGCAAVGLHARTAAQLYDGEARWEAIARAEARRDAHPGARQRRHLGGRGRAAHDAHDRLRRRRRRPRLPRPAVAVPRPRRRLRRAASRTIRRASAGWST